MAAINNLIQTYNDIGEFVKGLDLLEQMRVYVENHPEDVLHQCYYLAQKVISILLIHGVKDDLPDLFNEWEELVKQFTNYLGF